MPIIQRAICAFEKLSAKKIATSKRKRDRVEQRSVGSTAIVLRNICDWGGE